MVRVAGGEFRRGEERTPAFVPAFEIDRDPVTNADYAVFVRATGHRPPLFWRDGSLPAALAEHPVVGVDLFDALAYARWAGKDLPFEDEWERAARGTDGRTFPWGEAGDVEANTARTGLRMTLPVGFHAGNRSPEGCRDMVGNTWEWTLSPAPGGGAVIRGGSWFDFALYAKTWFPSAARPEARNGTLGFRCARRATPRDDAPRALAPAEVDAGIAARHAAVWRPAPGEWVPERRDLVPDLKRLRTFLAAHGRGALFRDAPAGPERPSPVGPPAVPPREAPPPAPRPPARPSPPPPEGVEPAAAVVEPPARVVAPPPPLATAPPDAGPALPTTPDPSSVPVEVLRPEPAEDEPEGASLRFVLLATGALAVAVTVLAVLLRGGRPPPLPPEDDPAVLGLPPAVASADDAGPPVLLGGGRPVPDLGPLLQGTTLLVFARPSDEAGRASARLAVDLHRRLRGRGVRTALVVPRGALAPAGAADAVPEEAALRRGLEAAGIAGGLTVVVDPDDGAPEPGRHRRGTFGLAEDVAAILLVDGHERLRALPPEGGVPLGRAHVAPLVRAALDAPALPFPRPDDAPTGAGG